MREPNPTALPARRDEKRKEEAPVARSEPGAGSPFGDDLTGTVDQNFIYAGGGNDKVVSKGDDSNTAAHDEIYGEDGDDDLDTVGGTGPHTVDSATGGNGTDSCLIDPNDVADCENVSNP